MKHLLHNVVSLLLIVVSLISCEPEKIIELEVSATTVQVASPASYFTVTSNEKWSIAQSGNYEFTVTPKQGPAGSTDVEIAYTHNESDSDRTSTLIITAGDKSRTVGLVQEKVSFEISPAKLTFPAEGGKQTLTVTSNIDWLAIITSRPDWIKNISPVSGAGGKKTEVTITVSENQKNSENTFQLPFKYGSKTQKVTIEQESSGLSFYKDGEYVTYMKSTKAQPITLIFTGDGYLEEDHNKGGAFDKDLNDAIEAFFDIEPYRTYREYFTVYKIAAYSKERGVSNTSTGVTKDTKFKMTWKGGNATNISSPDNGTSVFEWCKKIPGVTDNTLKKMSIGVVINSNTYAGTCHYWSSGKNIAMMTYKRNVSSSSMTYFGNTVRHEMGGHGFGLLGDEYVNSKTTIPDDEMENLKKWQGYGRNPNISRFPTIEESPWAHFKGLAGYGHVGMFEGARYYAYGVWRPEQNSCMIDNRPYYNSPSRFAIVRRILEIAGELTPVNDNDTPTVKAAKLQAALDRFLATDTQKTENATKASASFVGWDGVPYDFIPLAPPVLIED